MTDCCHHYIFIFLVIKLERKIFLTCLNQKGGKLKINYENHIFPKGRWVGACFCAEVTKPASLTDVLSIGPSDSGIVIPGIVLVDAFRPTLTSWFI